MLSPQPQPSIAPPLRTEYPPYFQQYMNELPPGDILPLMRRQIADVSALLGSLSDQQALHRYAPGKWSVKEVVGHMIDAERVFTYRAMCFARGERQSLPGFDEDAWIASADFDGRALRSLLDELRQVRAASLAMFEGMGPNTLDRRGIANNRVTTVRSVPFILAGHVQHHTRILRERYLAGA
jgi:hypothetical protein